MTHIQCTRKNGKIVSVELTNVQNKHLTNRYEASSNGHSFFHILSTPTHYEIWGELSDGCMVKIGAVDAEAGFVSYQ